MISNDIQYQYVDNALNINYHYVQDGQILNLKRKSMNGHSVFYVEKLGDLVQTNISNFWDYFYLCFYDTFIYCNYYYNTNNYCLFK